MKALKRLWNRIAYFAEALDGDDDPIGDYARSLGKRINKLERDVSRLKERPYSSSLDMSLFK